MSKGSKREAGHRGGDIATNRQARFRFHLLETFEAGIVLQGSEVKSARDGKVNLKDSFAVVRQGLATGFEPLAGGGRGGLGRWQSSRPMIGTWRGLLRPPPPGKPGEGGDDKARARGAPARHVGVFPGACGARRPGRASYGARVPDQGVRAGRRFVHRDQWAERVQQNLHGPLDLGIPSDSG